MSDAFYVAGVTPPAKKNDLVLGIDISFNCPGFALMRGDKLIESHQLIGRDKRQSIGDRLMDISFHLNELYGKDPWDGHFWRPDMMPDYVATEKINVGKTSFDTAKKMAYVEGVVFCFAQLNDFPLYEVNAKTARMKVLGKGKGNLKKEEVGAIVRSKYGEHLSLDETDAIVVALAGQLETGAITVSPFSPANERET